MGLPSDIIIDGQDVKLTPEQSAKVAEDIAEPYVASHVARINAARELAHLPQTQPSPAEAAAAQVARIAANRAASGLTPIVGHEPKPDEAAAAVVDFPAAFPAKSDEPEANPQMARARAAAGLPLPQTPAQRAEPEPLSDEDVHAGLLALLEPHALASDRDPVATLTRLVGGPSQAFGAGHECHLCHTLAGTIAATVYRCKPCSDRVLG